MENIEHSKQDLQRVQYVLFDLDGTLLDSREQLVNAAVKTISYFCEGTVHFDEVLEKFGSDLTISAKEKANPGAVNDYFIQQKSIDYRYNKLFPQIREGLVRMKEEGLTLAIVTNQVKALTLQVLEESDLFAFFDVIVTKDDVESPKPSAEMILKCMDSLGANPTNTIMVGDTMADWLAAKSANVDCFLLRFYEEDPIKDYHDKTYFFTFDELTSFIVSRGEGLTIV